MANIPHRRSSSDPRPASRPPQEGDATGLRAGVLLLGGLLVLAGCGADTGFSGPDTERAIVAVRGQVADPSDTGVENASVTITMHETADCSSSTLRQATGQTGGDGGFGALVGLTDPGSDFEPFEVCLDIRAEPPLSRPELGPGEAGGFTATLRQEGGSQPVDTVDVELTLPESGGG